MSTWMTFCVPGAPHDGALPPGVQLADAAADDEHHVGLAAHRLQAGAVERGKVAGVILGHDAARAQARGQRRREMVGQGQEIVPGAGPAQAAAGVQVRAARLAQERRGAADRLGVAAARPAGPVVARLPDRYVVCLARAAHDVFGNLQVDGSGPAGKRGAEGVAHHLGQTMPVAHAAGPLGHRPVKVEQGDVLEAAAAVWVNDGRASLPADGDDRAALGVGRNHAGEHVRRARANAADGDRRLPTDARVSVGHVRRCGLVARVNEADAVVVQFSQEGVEAAVEDTEHLRDALGLQGAQQQFAAGDGGHGSASFFG